MFLARYCFRLSRSDCSEDRVERQFVQLLLLLLANISVDVLYAGF